ncbi:MAG: FIST N-terminal domain-containing protein [Candidatus Nanopelagicales bacterium]
MTSLAVSTRTGDGLALGPDLADAARRAAAAARIQLGPGPAPDLALVWVSGGSPEQTAEALAAAYAGVGAATTLGCTAHGVMGAGRAVEGERAVSVWAARLPGVSLRSFHLEVLRTSEAIAVVGMPERRVDDAVGVLMADPWSFPVDGFVGQSYDVLRGLPLVGGLASGSVEPGATRLLVDGRVVDRGAVGVVLGGDVDVRTVVSQGCRPIGRPMTVTAAEGTRITELAGHSPLVQAQIAINELPEDARDMALSGLHLGVAMDEYAYEHGHGDFVARGLLAADDLDGSISVEDVVPVGATVQFLLRDASSAHDDLVEALGGLRREVGFDRLSGALLFAGDARGRELFATPEHDVAAIRSALGVEHVGGFFTSGEIGPVGGRNHVHGVTATLLAFVGSAP